MHRRSINFALLALAVNLPAHAAGSLCGAAEQTYFSCPVAGAEKIVSVCGAGNSGAHKGYLQYRSGLPGRIEFEYPKSRDGSTKLFWWESEGHFSATESWFWFESGGASYSLFTIEDHATDDGKPDVRTGVLIQKKGGDPSGLTNLQCAVPATGDFKRLQNIVDMKKQTE